ncbi:MAG: preprotein translocase subunit SecE [Anaerolineales bacterium]|nr:preprotein translocase subunit SecE [Anaerolineales bacterium]MCZ2123313.1 preprotein translocase subunit SecE [Anaerolineales bacterium]
MAEKEKKARRSENALQKYWRETTGELKKVSWPTWPEAWRLTQLVLLVMVVMGVFLGVMDTLGREVVNLLINVK